MNRNFTTKVSSFLLGNGFYIALTLCVGLIGLSGYYLMSAVHTNEVAPASANTTLEVPTTSITPQAPLPEVVAPSLEPESLVESEKETSQTVVTVEKEEQQEQAQDVVTEPEVSEEPKESEETIAVVEEVTATTFFLPVVGTLQQEHSIEVLSYHPTFGDWRTHTGIEVGTEIDAPVCAVADGYVSAVFSDDMTGTTVVLVHGEQLETTYTNLVEETLVEVGDTVLAGQLIGAVGETMLGTGDAPTQLHVSMTKGGKQVDPMEYLPEF